MESFTQIMKALSDLTRVRIIHLLSHQALCVCEMTAILNESQPKISKHMHTLYHAGLVKKSRSQQFITYRLNPDQPLLEALTSLVKTQQSSDELLQLDYQAYLNKDVWACQISEQIR